MDKIDFDLVYHSHRVAQYKDWIVVEPADAPIEFYAFLPPFSPTESELSDLDYIRDFMTDGLCDDDLDAIIAAIDKSDAENA